LAIFIFSYTKDSKTYNKTSITSWFYSIYTYLMATFLLFKVLSLSNPSNTFVLAPTPIDLFIVTWLSGINILQSNPGTFIFEFIKDNIS